MLADTQIHGFDLNFMRATKDGRFLVYINKIGTFCFTLAKFATVGPQYDSQEKGTLPELGSKSRKTVRPCAMFDNSTSSQSVVNQLPS